jgi:HlyD family secretion protein
MSKIKLFTYFIFISVVGFGLIKIYKIFFRKAEPQLFKAAPPQRKTLHQTISVSGILELKECYKIGSQVPGVVKEVCVKENDLVKNGQLLAVIELVKGDTDIRAAKHTLEKYQKEYAYQKENYERQQQLFKSSQLSKNAFQRIETDYLKALEDVNTQKVILEKTELELKNSRILAPSDGIITNVGISEGIAVLNDFQNILFELAQDISEMKSMFDIDESEVGQIHPGQKVKITINSYPEILIKEKIKEISFIPKTGVINGGSFYKACAILNNKNRILRPGMRLNGQIQIAKAPNALCINGLAFQVDSEILEKIAQKLRYAFAPLDEKIKKQFKKEHTEQGVRFIWAVEKSSFIQKPIIVGINDEISWEVLDGLQESDQVIVDIQEPSAMEKVYGEWFQGAL